MPTTYVLKWYHGDTPRYGWFIRGILPDRRFYGEITVFLAKGGRQVNISGSLSEPDYARLVSLVNKVGEGAARDDSDMPWEGLLAEGPVSRARVIFRYRPAEHETSATGRQFLEIVNLLAPYLRQFYRSLNRGI